MLFTNFGDKSHPPFQTLWTLIFHHDIKKQIMMNVICLWIEFSALIRFLTDASLSMRMMNNFVLYFHLLTLWWIGHSTVVHLVSNKLILFTPWKIFVDSSSNSVSRKSPATLNLLPSNGDRRSKFDSILFSINYWYDMKFPSSPTPIAFSQTL